MKNVGNFSAHNRSGLRDHVKSLIALVRYLDGTKKQLDKMVEYSNNGLDGHWGAFWCKTALNEIPETNEWPESLDDYLAKENYKRNGIDQCSQYATKSEQKTFDAAIEGLKKLYKDHQSVAEPTTAR
jgi:hypothetical protein